MIEGDITYRIPNHDGWGYLTVNQPNQHRSEWELVDIAVVPQRSGLGCRLIRMFCDDHPCNTKVCGPIGHDDSFAAVDKLDYHAPPGESRSFWLDDTEIIRTIPIFAFLDVSGISVTRVKITCDHSILGNPQIYMQYYGHTK